MEKAKEMLKVTTQDHICSSLLPLTSRYHTYLILKRLRRISCTFYTDTLFAKKKSIIGNTCAQIFTDVEGFVYVYPMRSKSQSGEDFNVATRDIGVPNTLI